MATKARLRRPSSPAVKAGVGRGSGGSGDICHADPTTVITTGRRNSPLDSSVKGKPNGKQSQKEQRILSVRLEKSSLPPSKPTFWWMPLYPVPQYYPQGKPMEGESRWES